MRDQSSFMHSVARLLVRVAFLVTSGALVACAHRAPDTVASEGEHAASDKAGSQSVVPLRIESHLSSDVVIYAVRGHMRQRIGSVSGPIRRMFTIPARFATDPGGFYLVAHRIGGSGGAEATSPSVTVQPGQTVVWTLEEDLSASQLAIE